MHLRKSFFSQHFNCLDASNSITSIVALCWFFSIDSIISLADQDVDFVLFFSNVAFIRSCFFFVWIFRISFIFNKKKKLVWWFLIKTNLFELKKRPLAKIWSKFVWIFTVNYHKVIDIWSTVEPSWFIIQIEGWSELIYLWNWITELKLISCFQSLFSYYFKLEHVSMWFGAYATIHGSFSRIRQKKMEKCNLIEVTINKNRPA